MFNECSIMRDVHTWEMSDMTTTHIWSQDNSSIAAIPAVTLTISSRDPPPMRNIDDGLGLAVAAHL